MVIGLTVLILSIDNVLHKCIIDESVIIISLILIVLATLRLAILILIIFSFPLDISSSRPLLQHPKTEFVYI